MTTKESPLVLVVDDEPANLSLMVDTLSGFGLEVIIAHDGPDGFAKAQQELPNLILLDVKLPIWNGFETCSRLKTNSITKNIPVIFLSVLNDHIDKIRGFQVGGVDYITKPFHEQEVLARVTTHLKYVCQFFSQVLEPSAVYSPRPLSHRIDNSIATSHIPPFLNQVRDLLLAHLHEPFSLKQLAHMVGTNPTKLSKIFQQYFGMTVFDYLREQRLVKAQYLLRQSNLTIQQIVDAVGYKNHSDFTVVFKQRFGLTPRQYRQDSN